MPAPRRTPPGERVVRAEEPLERRRLLLEERSVSEHRAAEDFGPDHEAAIRDPEADGPAEVDRAADVDIRDRGVEASHGEADPRGVRDRPHVARDEDVRRDAHVAISGIRSRVARGQEHVGAERPRDGTAVCAEDARVEPEA